MTFNKLYYLLMAILLFTSSNARLKGKSHRRNRNKRKRNAPRKPKQPNCYEKFGMSMTLKLDIATSFFQKYLFNTRNTYK